MIRVLEVRKVRKVLGVLGVRKALEGVPRRSWHASQKRARATALVLGCLLLLAASACKKPIQPTVVYPGLPFDIRPGRVVTIPGSLTVIFDRVVSDSRCPTGVTCVTAGDAIVHLIVADSASRVERDLHTGSEDAAKTTVSNYTIRLVDLLPYPREGRVILPEDYTATLQITSP